MLSSPPTEDIAEIRPKRRRTIVVACCVILPLLFIAGCLTVERYQGKAALAKYEARLRTNGETLTFEELWPPLPEGENKGPDLYALASSLRTGAVMPDHAPPVMRLIAPGKAIVVFQQDGWFTGRQGQSSWRELEAELQSNSATLAELRSLAEAPVLRSVIHYRGAETLLPHLGHVRKTCLWFAASAMLNLRNGDVAAAIDEAVAITAFTRALEHEPIVISQLVRIAAATVLFDTTWQILHSPHVSDADLQRLQKIIYEIRAIDGMILALQGERAAVRYSANVFRRSGYNLAHLLSKWGYVPLDDGGDSFVEKLPYAGKAGEAIGKALIPLWQFAWCFDDEHCAYTEIDRFIDAHRAAKHEQSLLPVKKLGDSEDHARKFYSSPHYLVTQLFVPWLSSGSARAYRFETHRELVLTAIGLKRYHLRHGTFPNTLQELVPAYLSQSPVDYMDGKPLRYRRGGSSFVLWSVGNDGQDGGGVPNQAVSYATFTGRYDFVWPQSASDEEVEEYTSKRRQ